jgi:hypothetical protein
MSDTEEYLKPKSPSESSNWYYHFEKDDGEPLCNRQTGEYVRVKQRTHDRICTTCQAKVQNKNKPTRREKQLERLGIDVEELENGKNFSVSSDNE